MLTIESLRERYPLHMYVWNNDYRLLDEALATNNHNIEEIDPRGRTPLMLAVTLDHLESARVLLRHGANASAVNQHRWTVSQEAVSTGDPEILKLILAYRDGQREENEAKIVSDLLHILLEVPDFYVEMGWEFTSWLPMVSRMCPSDVCRVWKKGSSLRIDTTLMGMSSNNTWLKGNLTYLFRATPHGAMSDAIHHTQKIIYRHEMRLQPSRPTIYRDHAPSDDFVARKLTQPVFATYIDVDKIEIERSKSGILGWWSDRKETIGKQECEVYSANNVQVVTLRRTEHMTEQDKAKMRDNGTGVGGLSFATNALTSLLTGVENPVDVTKEKEINYEVNAFNPGQITPEEYFDSSLDLASREMGRPKEMTSRIKTFKAHMWMCKDYPLTLKDQVLPVIELMAQHNPHFNKLKEFIAMQLPHGFPVKIEIPLYHMLNARITFSNLFGSEKPVTDVTYLPSTSTSDLTNTTNKAMGKCIIEDSVFTPPDSYYVRSDSPVYSGGLDEEEQLLQMALQQSLMEYDGTPDLDLQRRAEKRKKIVQPPVLIRRIVDEGEEDSEMLQRAIAASLGQNDPVTVPIDSLVDVVATEDEFSLALEISKRELSQEEERQRREEEELQRVLELSKLEM